MDLLDFARGPALAVALVVFVLGSLWRLIAVLRRPRMPDLSPARDGAPSKLAGAWRNILRGMWPRKEFGPGPLVVTINGYVFHIGTAVTKFAKQLGCGSEDPPGLQTDMFFNIGGFNSGHGLLPTQRRYDDRHRRMPSTFRATGCRCPVDEFSNHWCMLRAPAGSQQASGCHTEADAGCRRESPGPSSKKF